MIRFGAKLSASAVDCVLTAAGAVLPTTAFADSSSNVVNITFWNGHPSGDLSWRR